MFHTICKSNILCYGRHWSQPTRICRTTGSVIMKGRHMYQQRPSTITQEHSIKKSSSMHHYLAKKNHEQDEDSRQRFNHSNQVGMLFGIMGTAAVLGMGSALCKTNEDVPEKDLPPESLKASTETNISTKDLLKNEDTHWIGRDVVGTEKIELKNQEASQQASVHTQNIPETTSTVAILGSLQKERLSDFQKIVRKSRQLLKHRMEEAGAPGLAVSVSVDGKTVWADGFGFADLENHVRCSPDTVMRIASISKSLTMTAVARLWEEGKLDLDAPIQKYIPSFPVKTYNGDKVTITTRHLLSHQSGIRHYKLKDPNKKEKEEENKNKEKVNIVSKKAQKKDKDEKNEKLQENKGEKHEIQDEKVQSSTVPEKEASDNKQSENEKRDGIVSAAEQKKNELNKVIKAKSNKRRKKRKKEEEEDEDNEFDMEEYYIKEEFDTIQEALELFQNDELFFKPGSGYLYTTHGWTAVSGVVEGAAGKPFTKVITRLFYDLGLDNTYLDKNTPIIYNRARYYIRDKHGQLKNAPYVDNSYKWAGGGFLSTVRDLSKFGNAMLYASQHNAEDCEDTNGLPGFLKASTMRDLWTPVKGTSVNWVRDRGYGMGWVAAEDKSSYGFCRSSRQYASHTGGAIGASSVLLVLPKQSYCSKEHGAPPKGVVVAIITNMQGVGLNNVALQIAQLFEDMK